MGQPQGNPRNLNRVSTYTNTNENFYDLMNNYLSGRMGIGPNLDVKRRANREILKDRKRQSGSIESALLLVATILRIGATLNKYVNFPSPD